MTSKSKLNTMPTYIQQVKKILQDLNVADARSFNQARRAVFNSPVLQQLVSQKLQRPIVALSAGTSTQKAFPAYLRQVARDFKTKTYYQEYAVPIGPAVARQALSLLENQRFETALYDSDEFCLTEGSTGAITAVFEALKRQDPTAEVLIASPAYYLYKLAAEYFGLAYREVNLMAEGKTSLQQLTRAITDKTKLIVVSSPTNPQGEIFLTTEIENLLIRAKQKNCLVLVDELFEELVFEQGVYRNFDQIAQKIDALENLITIKGYSKSKNLAGLRIGYAFSKNKNLMQQITKVLEQRQCFPVASVFTGLICLDAFLRIAQLRSTNKTVSIKTRLQETKNIFSFSEAIQDKSLPELEKIYRQFLKYSIRQKWYYRKLYQQAIVSLRPLLSDRADTRVAFNTFVKIDALKMSNQFDFTLSTFIFTGIKVELGPCFGWSQAEWEQNPELGFWLRLSFSQESEEYLNAIERLKKFIPDYLADQNKYIQTKWSF